ncbi:uncharacterized protein LOC142765073 [Rhipicephalus microplus]|uniref:uncharacterized protein LOC142765073 n=1 Tax=Rhipicephalus microplus TaxID=6941 RepID=UPI0023765476
MTSSSSRGDTAQRHAKFQAVWRKWMLGFISAAFLVGMTIGVAFTYPTSGSGGTPCMLPLLRACARRTNDSSEFSGPRSLSPWFFVRSNHKGHCVQWNSDQVCLGVSPLHFNSLSLCQAYCEKNTPNARCTQPIETAMLHCSNEDFHEARKKKWWYYDSRNRTCLPWEQVCLDNTYASLRACAAACLGKQ